MANAQRAWIRLVASLFLLSLTGCMPDGLSFMTPAGPVATAERAHLFTVTLIALIVVVPVLIGTPLIAWRYRRDRRARYAPEWEYSRRLEWAMWGVPVVVVAILGWQLARAAVVLDPYKRIDPALAPVRFQAIGLDWKWLFVYPDHGIASLNELVLPAGQPVNIRLTSDTVMQSFFIGALGSQIYAMPGMETRLNLLAERAGVYEGENSQYNGFGLQHQKFVTRVMTRAGFDVWVAGVRRSDVPLDAANYAALGYASTPAMAAYAFARPGIPKGVAWFSRVEPGLFDAVLHRYMSGRPLSDAAQPGSPGYRGIPPALPAAAVPATTGAKRIHGTKGMHMAHPDPGAADAAVKTPPTGPH